MHLLPSSSSFSNTQKSAAKSTNEIAFARNSLRKY
jgi:hypothetical protein